jgi:hypothetical protein
VIEGKQTELM